MNRRVAVSNRIRRAAVFLAACVLQAGATGAVCAADARFETPLAVANQSPVARLFGLPRAQGGAITDTPALHLRAEITNNFTSRLITPDLVAFDGETMVLTAGVRAPVAARWEWGVEVPFVRHAGGSTDRLIDWYHDLLGLPDSGRSEVSRNRLDYRLRLDGDEWFEVSSATDGVGDMSAWVGYQLFATPARALALRLLLKAPTGAARDLTGSDAVDGSLWLDYSDRSILSRVGVGLTLMGGLTRLGRGELVPHAQEEYAFSGHLGLQYPAAAWLTLLAQVDTHSRLLDTRFDEVAGGAVLGTLGGRVHLPRGLAFDIAVVEDLRSRSAPDVTFHFQLTGRL